MDKQKKIPVLRFPEFTDDWSNLKYGSIFSFRSTNSYSRENLNYSDGLVKNIHYGDIHTKFNTLFDITIEEVPFVNTEIELKNVPDDNYCKAGDLIIADASEDYADIGKCIEIVNLNNEKVVSGLHTILARPDLHKMAIGFNGHLMKSEKVRLQIKTIAQGSKVLSISTKRLAEIDLSIPQIPEQQKIASFLTAIDDKLTQLKQKKSLLEQYKKGVMQKIFSQEIRFKDENGNDYPKWEKKKLGDIGEFKNGINKSKEDFGFGVPFVNLMDVFGKSTISDLKLDLVNANEKEIKLYELKKGDVLFIRSSVKKEGVGETSLVLKDLNNTVFSGFLIRFRDEKIMLDLNFKKYCFATRKFRESLISLSTTSANTNINQESLNDLIISLPAIPEQIQIANFLSAIDEKINHCQLQIAKTVLYKKGLLQKMFC